MTNLSDIDLYRRIDWRFLLPRPLPARVGYIGEPGGNLTALERVADVTRINPSSAESVQGGSNPKFELVVVSSRDPGHLRTAVRFVAPEGMLYWEIPPGKHCIWRSRRYLHKMSFPDVEFFWHRPDFENCREIVPVSDSEPLMRFLGSRRSGFPWTLAARAAQCLISAGVFPQQLVRCLAILAVRSRA